MISEVSEIERLRRARLNFLRLRWGGIAALALALLLALTVLMSD